MARPSRTKGIDPARSAATIRVHSRVESEAEVVASAIETTTATEAIVKPGGGAIPRAAIRTTGRSGSVRTQACHGVPRSIAPETPNWKNPTPSTPNAAYE